MINERQKKALDERLRRFSSSGVEQIIATWVGYATSGTDSVSISIPTEDKPWALGTHIKINTVDAIAYAAQVLEEMKRDEPVTTYEMG